MTLKSLVLLTQPHFWSEGSVWLRVNPSPCNQVKALLPRMLPTLTVNPLVAPAAWGRRSMVYSSQAPHTSFPGLPTGDKEREEMAAPPMMAWW